MASLTMRRIPSASLVNYLRHSDPLVTTRTWGNVLDEIISLKTGPTQARWKSAAKDKP
jgi:hypothetical protein